MPKRTALQTVHVQRDGQPVVVKPGDVFDFTPEELDDIKALNPDAVRTPIAEDTETDLGKVKDSEVKKAEEQAAATKKAQEEAAAKVAASKKAAPTSGKASADSL